jgi:hypothetical protein
VILQTSFLPYSLFSYLIDEVRDVDDSVAFRPDRIIAEKYGGSFSMEVVCNEVSNLSPLSTVNGAEYVLPSRLFTETFIEVGV